MDLIFLFVELTRNSSGWVPILSPSLVEFSCGVGVQFCCLRLSWALTIKHNGICDPNFVLDISSSQVKIRYTIVWLGQG